MQFTNIQEACDYSVQKIVEQGGQCKFITTCVYGDDNGRHCAVGWLIPENIANADQIFSFTGCLEYLDRKFHDSLPDIITENLDVLKSLQDFHDRETSYSRKLCMEYLSNRFGIDTSGIHWQQWVDMGQ